jgi:hypothetical protein
VESLNKILSKNGIILNYKLRKVGNNFVLVVVGGEEHIGCTILAIPRPSLKNPETISCTISTLNVLGHKDDILAKPLAEKLCIITNQPAVVIAGVHFDNITINQLMIIEELNQEALINLNNWVNELRDKINQ